MRLYQTDLAKQCGIGCAKSGFQLSGILKRRLKKSVYEASAFGDSVVLETGMWRLKSSTKAKIIVIGTENKAARGGRREGTLMPHNRTHFRVPLLI